MINIDLIKELRKRTGLSIITCKKILLESNENIELALSNIEKDNSIKSIEKSKNITKEGIILIKVADNFKKGVIIELNCETDFIARNKIFKDFGADIIHTALNESISDIDFLKKKFETKRISIVNKLNENINIRRIKLLHGEVLGHYLHNIDISRIGVLVSAIGNNIKVIHNIAMHIAASKPKYIDIHGIPTCIIEKERKKYLDIALKSGKKLSIAEKIVIGRMNKFYTDIVLNNQHFIIDTNKTVNQILKENNIIIKDYVRFEVNELL